LFATERNGTMIEKAKDVDSYIANSAGEARPTLKAIRKLIRSTIPKAEESISWSVPFYKYHGGLVGFAVYKNHVSLGFGAADLQRKDREMLENKGYKTGIKTMQIRFDQKVPAAAIKQILKAQAKVNEAKIAKK
jgi:uncharacterized protein YdhG (YjbR/CyaY superfamily)